MGRLLPLLAVLAVAALACESDDLVSADIVSTVPWSGPGAETENYRVLDDDGDEAGSLEMTIEPAGSGEVRLGQAFDFPANGFTNDAAVVADAETLQPRSARFEIRGPEGDLTCEAEYGESEVTVHRVGEDGERSDTLDVPQFAYDSWSDLFVWRTLEFSEGYEVEYTDILSCTLDRTQKLGVKLKVKERKELTVPAGDFETWHLEISSGGGDQDAWYTADDERRLVRYDNGSEVFELVE
jgi:hypothetical protein